MVESEQKPLAPKGKLTPLAPKETEGVVKDLESKGATFFDWEKFQELTKNLPPNTRISDILKSLKKTK